MKTKNASILRAAVAVALGMTPVFALAATNYAPSKPVILATEIEVPEGAQVKLMGSYAITLDMKDFSGRSIDSNVTPLEVRLKLTDGAVFDAGLSADSFNCAYTGTPIPRASTALSILNGGANQNAVTFKMDKGDFTNQAGKQICVFSGAIKLNSGQKAYSMSVTAYLKSPVASDEVKMDTLAGAVVDFKQSWIASVTPNDVLINVASPYFAKKFGAQGAVSAQLGSVTFANVDASIKKTTSLVDGALVAVGVGDVLPGSVKIVLSGDPLKTTNAVVVRELSTTPAGNRCQTVVAGGYTPLGVKTANASGVVSFDTVPAAEFAAAAFCLVVDGENRVEKGTVTYEFVKSSGKANLDVAGDKVLATFKKNGTSVKVLNVPAPDDTSDPVNIRVYNMSSSEAKVYGTLYQMNGQIVGGKSNVELATVPANGVKVINAKTLSSVLAVSTWAGRAWLQLEGDSQSLRVQALMYTGTPSATGAKTIINMSDRVLSDSER